MICVQFQNPLGIGRGLAHGTHHLFHLWTQVIGIGNQTGCGTGETIGEDVLLPIYLSDAVFHLQYYPIGGAFNRTLKIIKMRGTAHGEGVYPYIFSRGAGAIVRSTPIEVSKKERANFDAVFDEAIKTAESMKAPAHIIERIKTMKEGWVFNYSPEEALQIVFDTYKLK